MRIEQISVMRLFGLFDHVIEVNLDERVTIIHGPNGYGKTTILHLVESLFAGRYYELRKIPFRDLTIDFQEGYSLEVIRVQSATVQKGRAEIALTITLRKGREEKKTTLTGVSAETYERMGYPLAYIDQSLPHLVRISHTQWRDSKTGEVLDFEDIVRDYGRLFGGMPLEKLASSQEIDWLRDFRREVRVRFIESQRLLRLNKKHSHHREESDGVRPSVLVYAKDLAKEIQVKLAEYATLSQSLDRSFPKRLIEQAGKKGRARTSQAALKQKLEELESKRNTLVEAGLLDRDNEGFDLASYLSDPQITENVLPVYAESEEQKLKVFDEMASKIELLKSIVNNHFQFKTLNISKERGFEFITRYPNDKSKPRPLTLSHLSSGEQHLLVLLYELLFTVKPNSLIMIDEPEISLHVAWQLELLADIQRITELSGIDVLIATHSPAIINDRMDLTVELSAPGQAS